MQAGHTYFFDSWGGLYQAVGAYPPAEEADAHVMHAFGPTGIAREATLEEVGLVCDPEHRTAHAAARRDGRLLRAEECHEWDRLLPALPSPAMSRELAEEVRRVAGALVEQHRCAACDTAEAAHECCDVGAAAYLLREAATSRLGEGDIEVCE